MYEWYEIWKDENWIKSCGIKNTTAQSYFSVIIMELGVIIILMASGILKYLQKNRLKEE